MSDSEEEEIVAVPGQQLAGRKRRRTNAARLEAPVRLNGAEANSHAIVELGRLQERLHLLNLETGSECLLVVRLPSGKRRTVATEAVLGAAGAAMAAVKAAEADSDLAGRAATAPAGSFTEVETRQVQAVLLAT